jgi:hypothetical protein
MRIGVGSGSRVKQNTNAVIDGVVVGAGVAMPKEPPARFWVGEGGVVRVFSEEVTIIDPVGEKIGTFGDGGTGAFSKTPQEEGEDVE